ncbi:hypothetical protein ACFO4M_19120 [Pseudonocardia nematodicida]
MPAARPDGPAARDVLRDLDADRSALSGRMAAPAWTHVAFALLAAGFVLSPAFSGGLRAALVPVLVLLTVVLLGYQQSTTGVRARGVGARAWLAFAGALVGVLVLLSVSYGLVASLSPWWVLAPAAVAFGIVLAANIAFERSTREHLRRGR